MKQCCKNCENLSYYNGYYCNLELIQYVKNKKSLELQDIENDKCEMFLQRENKFWDDGEF